MSSFHFHTPLLSFFGTEQSGNGSAVKCVGQALSLQIFSILQHSHFLINFKKKNTPPKKQRSVKTTYFFISQVTSNTVKSKQTKLKTFGVFVKKMLCNIINFLFFIAYSWVKKKWGDISFDIIRQNKCLHQRFYLLYLLH